MLRDTNTVHADPSEDCTISALIDPYMSAIYIRAKGQTLAINLWPDDHDYSLTSSQRNLINFRNKLNQAVDKELRSLKEGQSHE